MHRPRCLPVVLLVLLVLLALLTAHLPGSAADPPPRPNLVVIMADDLGWQDVGYHGGEIATPRIDRLAAEGVRMERFYALQECTPTRAALLTGRHPIRYGLQEGVFWHWTKGGLPLAERTLADALRAAGYATALVGKWHLGLHEPAYLPLARGFDRAYGPYGGVIDYFVHQYYQGLDWHRDGKPLVEEGYATTLFAREAERLVAAHDFAAKPLFLLFAPTAPHAPMQVPPEYVAPYATIPDELRRTYAGMTAALDEAVGRVLDALAARAVLDRTLVVFLSDNGGSSLLGGSNKPLRGAKSELWEGGVRVPAIASWPGVLPAWAVRQTPVHVIDLFPTFVRLAGGSLEQPLPLDGLDAWPAIARGEPLARQELLINAQAHQSALLAGDLKLVRTQSIEGPRVELYDVAADPGEKRDLAPRMRERVDELSDRLLAWQQEAQRPLGPYPNKLPLGYAVPTVWGEPGSPPAPVWRRNQAPRAAPAP